LLAVNLIDAALMKATKGRKPWFLSLFQHPLKARGRSKIGAVFKLHVVAYNLYTHHQPAQGTGGDDMKRVIRYPKALVSGSRTVDSGSQKPPASTLCAAMLMDTAPTTVTSLPRSLLPLTFF
jgi:hypothetical protein